MSDESAWYPEGDWSVDSGWYEVTSGGTLRQCDILPQCPVLRLGQKRRWPIAASDVLAAYFETYDSIVLSQSCDLENQKVEDVLLAQVFAWPAVVRQELERNNQIVKKRQFRKRLIEGNQPGQALLHKYDGEPRLDWSIVNFQRMYTVQKEFLVQFASSIGPRLRLRAPYREHLAQAFARFVMRVGLPHDAKAVETEGDVKL
jgi:hypothetical protein